MTTPRDRSRGVGRFTVATWFQVVLGVMGIVVLVGAGAGAQVIGNTNVATDRVLNRTQPALVQATRLQGAFLDQETGVRGYALTGDRQFLEPYTAGLERQTHAAEQIRALVSESPQLLADLDAVQRAADSWRSEYALAGTAAATVPAGSTVRGKALFDELRARLDTQEQGLRTAIAADRAALEHARALRNWVLGLMVAVTLLTGVILTWFVRRLVARPLSQLAKASLRVADGDFEHHIEVAGPADVATVADAVERMRGQVVAELDSSRAQEALLSEQKDVLDAQAEDLRRSNSELEQFAYVASHDLQEPLRKVASFCQLLEKRYGTQLDDRGKQYIHFAVDGAKRMQTLINDLLTFSRVGRDTATAAVVDLGACLNNAVGDLGSVIDDSGARLELPELLPRVNGDSTLLSMLWQNLISNAIKFRSPDRTPLVRVACELDPEARMWVVTVTDNGIGIEPEFAEQVFVIFQRLHAKDVYAGTGIGLAVCRKIVEYHGGTIGIDTAYTGGTRFRFTLPVSAENDDHSTTTPDSTAVALEGVPL
ncbi:ATP-binding protein [Nocardia sp. NPDC057668]|uniref:sensor histidine kinase n=1 Tax=Nocardia sp. NPDC057668 TaxID=3346202 RepID=UPI00367060E3